MLRNLFLLSIPVFILSVGCGKSEPVAEKSPTETPAAPQITPSTEVVSQFLDLIRRGGEDTAANQLLTEKARFVLTEINQPIQPIGSPQASFKVTRAADVPNEENAQVVHTIWSDPNEEDYEVIWAVQLESGKWRISGLAMETTPGQTQIVNFEDREMMSLLLNVQPAQQASGTPSQAKSPENTNIR